MASTALDPAPGASFVDFKGPAVLKVKMKIENKLPPGSGLKPAETDDFRRNMAIRTLPWEGAAKIKRKNILKYSWERVGGIGRKGHKIGPSCENSKWGTTGKHIDGVRLCFGIVAGATTRHCGC